LVAFEAIIQNDTGDRERIRIGGNSWIKGYLLVFNHGGQITIGEHCFIGSDSKIWSACNIHIGNRVLISHNVNIHDSNSHPTDAQKRHLDYLHIRSKGLPLENDLNEKAIIIEDDVWIGFNSIILKGVKIGKGAIIGAGSLIAKDVESYTIVAGNPAVVIKNIERTC
jgi:acetyltransferase-like isoleucine patch superfamily enzyme